MSGSQLPFRPGTFEVLVEVQLRPGIADPAGATIERALPALGFSGVSQVRAGKAFRLHIEAPDEQAARLKAEELCHRLLTNPVIEQYVLTVEPVA
jgi:phosphoribosylformylglycinamidine synthase PurS subunit